MFYIAIAIFYILGDKAFHLYTFSPLAVYILIGLAIIQQYAKTKKGY